MNFLFEYKAVLMLVTSVNCQIVPWRVKCSEPPQWDTVPSSSFYSSPSVGRPHWTKLPEVKYGLQY